MLPNARDGIFPGFFSGKMRFLGNGIRECRPLWLLVQFWSSIWIVSGPVLIPFKNKYLMIWTHFKLMNTRQIWHSDLHRLFKNILTNAEQLNLVVRSLLNVEHVLC